ncbi:MAG: hypothetical protein ACFFDW_07990 [Candidatus Thorarchaeota archaeon]
MPHCPKCGVEVEPNKIQCPLCNTPIKEEEESEDYKGKYPEEPAVTEQVPRRFSKRKRMLVWEISSFVLLIPLIVTLSVDLIVNGEVGWSLYPISSLIFTWLVMTIPLLFPKRFILIGISELLFPLTFFLIIDLIDNLSIDWYPVLALPIILITAAVVAIITLISLKVKKRGLNIVAVVLFGVGVVCVCIDLVITYFLQGKFGAIWSLFVLVPTVLIGGFLLYLHYRVMKGKDFKRKINP